MPVLNSIAAGASEMAAWRQHIHANPELGFDCHQTAAFVAERLRDFGVDEIHEGIAQTGIVALIRGRAEGPTIGLRADMDALPMPEETGAAYASKSPGKMHACGHDGHTAMLLGAARYLAETRNFAGTVALIFQPAEEIGGGGEKMVNEGALSRFGVEKVFGIHTSASLPLGRMVTRPGPFMASASSFTITIKGRGGHGSRPQDTVDPLAAALQIGQALNSIVSRNLAPIANAVVSVTQIHGGTTHNVIPETAMLGGTVRTFSPEVENRIRARMQAICDGIAAAMEVDVVFGYDQQVPTTINDPDMAGFAARVARDVVGPEMVDDEFELILGGEDFSYMLNEVPGAFLFVGQGIGPGVHNTKFDFNDEAAPYGASYLARLVETAQPA